MKFNLVVSMYIGKSSSLLKKNDSNIRISTRYCKQLKSVQPISNTKDYKPYVDSIIDNILEHHILLTKEIT